MGASRETLYNYFLTGEKPTQAQFAALIAGCFNLNDDTFANELRSIILPDDERLTNADGVYTLDWDVTLAAQFGTAEATIKVLFDNGAGGYREQKQIQPVYNYDGEAVSSITLELLVAVNFKIIVTV